MRYPIARPLLLSLVGSFLAGSALAAPQQSGTVLFTEKITRGAYGDQFGRSVDLLGDLDDDGVPDLVVGASHCDDGNEDSGSIYIVFMNADRSVKSAQKISNDVGGLTSTLGYNDQFGKSVSAIGDLDGDGVEDVAVGAAREEEVHVLLMNTNGTVKSHEIIANSSGDFGYAIAPVGDYDGDGVTDLVIGDGKGDAFLYFMNTDGTTSGYEEITGDSSGGSDGFNDFFGLGLRAIGDWDGDGAIDIAVGDTAYDGGFTDSGAVHLLTFDDEGDVQSEILIHDGVPGFDLGLPDYPNFGRDIAVIDDLDGNGVPELVIACSECYDANEPEDSGALYVVFLDAAGNVLEYRQISRYSGNLGLPLTGFDEFGISVANIGDWNGDGTSDLAVGARFAEAGNGVLYLLMMDDGTGTPVDASFEATPTTGIAPLAVQFTDTSDGEVTAWAWDFGDGGVSADQDPSYTYTTEGDYTVTLTVTHTGGATHTTVVSDAVSVQPANADFLQLGCGTNPVGSLSVVNGEPVIGTTLTFGVDNPLGTQPVGSPAGVAFAWDPDSNYPCGRLIPGMGMSGAGTSGELLISLVPPNPVRISIGTPWGGPGVLGIVTLNIPNKPNLVGKKLYAQGFIVDRTGTSSIQRGLADAIEITIR